MRASRARVARSISISCCTNPSQRGRHASQGQDRHRGGCRPIAGRGPGQRPRHRAAVRAGGSQGARRRQQPRLRRGDGRHGATIARGMHRVRGRRHARGEPRGHGRGGAVALGPHRRPALQCRREHRRRRRTARPGQRGGVRPHRGREPARRHHGLQARAAADARAALGRDHDDLVGRRLGAVSQRGLQGDQGRADRLHSAGRHSERRVRSARQRHPAGLDGHADGGRYPRSRQREEPGGGGGGPRRPRAAAPPHGDRLGRRQRGPVPRLRRGEFHHRRRASGRRRRPGEIN